MEPSLTPSGVAGNVRDHLVRSDQGGQSTRGQVRPTKGKGVNPKKGQGCGPEGRPKDRAKKIVQEKRCGVSSLRACPCVYVCLLALLSRSRVVQVVLVWCLPRPLPGRPWCSCPGASGWSMSGVGVVVSPFPVFRQVQIEGSCTVAGANLGTGRVMSGIPLQGREGIPARRRRLRCCLLLRLR